MRRLLVGLLLPVLMLPAACGGEDAGPAEVEAGKLADITVSGGPGERPVVEFKAPLSFPETVSEVVDKGPGTGDSVESTSVVTVDYVAINASDASRYDSTWSKGGSPATFPVDQVIEGLSVGLRGTHPGDRVLVAVASEDGYDPVGKGDDVRKGDSLIFVIDVREVSNALKAVSGPKRPAPATVPTLKVNAEGVPTGFEATKSTPKSVDKLGVHAVVEGKGAAVKSGQTIVVNYLGQLYPDGEVFDESYTTGETLPVQIGQGQVIPGWDEGLVGQTVGSRVILVIPSAQGYGPAGQGEAIPPDSDLIFVVDILQAY